MPYRVASRPGTNRRLLLLDRVALKTSCRASWDEMVGDATTRFCCICSKNVYDLTAMHPVDAEAFLAPHLASDGPLPCARIYQRRDGRVLTSECRTGQDRRHLRRLARTLAVGAAGAALATGVVDLAMRPVLAPDVGDEPMAAEYDPQLMRRETDFGPTIMGELAEIAEPRYDVNRALRSDEPMPWMTSTGEVEPEGIVRRRSVRANPDEAFHARITLVTDTEGFTESSRRRRRTPAL